MKIHIDVRKLPWDFHDKTDPPHVQKLRERLHAIFADYAPRRMTESHRVHTHELTVPSDDAKVDSLLKQFDREIRQSKQPVAAAVSKLLEPAEVKRARFIPLTVYGDDVDLNNYEEPLNPVTVLCETCKFPDITRVPEPLLVNKAKVKKQDIHSANTVLVVRPHVLELLRQSIGDQIEFGDVRYVVKGKPEAGTPPAAERLHWVRPKEVVGQATERGITINKRCPGCKRVIDSDQQMLDEYLTAQGPGVHLLPRELQHFGDGNADLAVVPRSRWMDDVDHSRQRHWSVNFVVSGALFTHLKSAGVKGIGLDQPTPYCTSARGEPALEPEARTFGGRPPAKAAQAARQATDRVSAGSKATAALKDVPWDYDDKGYVYLHLSTPEVVILDPMTWEQDNSGPRRVKKFKKPGLYRMPVTAIKAADDGEGVSVDSATLLLVDGAFFAELQDAYDWDKARKKNGDLDARYHQKLAEQIGTRFGLCTTPPRKFKSQFVGDGVYTLDPKQIEPAP